MASTFLEGTYTEVYPSITPDEEGLRRLFRQFSFPGGIPSHVAPETPGSIHEGGELGYALVHAYGAAFDNPDLLVCCVVGDGEAETGPLAASWHSNKFVDPARDGAVLPVLHLNGYKIANPTVLARIPHDELRALLVGYGHEPYFVEGDDPATMHQLMAETLDQVVSDIAAIQARAREGDTERPRWPMIVLRTPKGWTGPKEVDGRPMEGTFRAHQVPLAKLAENPEHLAALEAWMRSYRPEELFDDNGRVADEITAWRPTARDAWAPTRTRTNSRAAMGEFAIGQGVPRFEDPRLLRGGGKYVDDIVLPGMAFGHVLRSPHAHAKIRSIDTSKAKAAAGVLCVLTGDDWIKSGWGDLPVPGTHKRRDGSTNYKPRYPALVKDEVRFVGDYVAFVVAETKNQAMDAAELIEVDYQTLPATIATAEAAKSDAALVWSDCKDNICFTAIHGDKAKTEEAFKHAAHVVKEHLVINRVTTASMEPRGSVGDYNAIEDKYTIYTTLQRAHPYRAELAKLVLKVPEHKVRVVAPDIGGSFGMKSAIYNEVPLVLLASKKIGRPVKWMSTRSEAFLSDAQARDNVTDAELALDKDGTFLAFRVNSTVNAGAYLQSGFQAYTGNRHARGRLSDPGDVCGIDGGVHPHPADAALSRQRPAGGGLRHRAHGRCRRGPTEDGPG